jgi:hypothetical protein
MLIQSYIQPTENKEDQQLNSAERGKLRRNPQPGRNREPEK